MVRTRFLWVFVCLFVLYPAQPAPALKLHYSMNSIKVQGRPGQYFVRTIQVGLPEDEPAGRIEFVPPREGARPTSVVIPTEGVFPEPIRTRAIYVQLPDSEQLPSGHYLVRVILDIGIDHYIGVQKETDIERDSVPEQEKK